MRSLVVLLLVAVAAGALFLVTKSLDKGTSSDLGPRPTETAPDETDEADVVQPATDPQTRVTQVAIETGRQDVVAPEDTSADYENSLSGRVVDTDGNPIPGALVVLTSQPLMGEAIAQAWFMEGDGGGSTATYRQETKTNAEGRYTFRGIEPSPTYYLVAQHKDYSFTQESYVSVGAQGDFIGPDVVLSPGSVLFGYVTDTNGNPIPDANVHLDSAYMLGEEIESPDRVSTTTDAQGYYEIKNVAKGPRNISVEAEGQANQILHNQMFKGTADERIQKDFRLEIGVPLGGVVVGPDGAPIAGASVLAMNYGNNTSSRGRAVTDENGNFLLQDLRKGKYILLVSARGYRPGRLNRVDAGDMNTRIEMLAQASVAGVVVDEASNAPVTGFRASIRRITPGGNTYESIGVEESFQSADGSFVLPGVDPGRFVAYVEAPGYAPCVSEPFDVRGSEDVTNIQVRMNAGGTIRGRVVDSSGQPIAGARVSSHDGFYVEDNLSGMFGSLLATAATERTARSGADGTFELRLLNPGDYTVRLSHPEFTREYVKNLTVTKGRAAEIGDVTLRGGGAVRGKVYDRAGNPLQRGYVHLRSDDPNSTYDTRTDQDGAYEFRHVRAGTYRLSASGHGPGSADPFTSLAEETHSEVQVGVSEGGTVNQDLNLGG